MLAGLMANQAQAFHGHIYNKIHQNKSDIETNKSNITNVSEESDAGIAGATAMAMLPEVSGALSLGVGNHNSGTAGAIGYTKDLNERTRIKAGATYDSMNNTSVGLGAAFKF